MTNRARLLAARIQALRTAVDRVAPVALAGREARVLRAALDAVRRDVRSRGRVTDEDELDVQEVAERLRRATSGLPLRVPELGPWLLDRRGPTRPLEASRRTA